ncbi:MAG: hypothetical protein M3Z25_18140 [Actinomycetota bacterium]|nr:hypothetical protein [Actinomycetota bacterium]
MTTTHRRSVEDLNSTIRIAVGAALTAVMNSRAPGCPTLYWSFTDDRAGLPGGLEGMAGPEYPDDEAGAAIGWWAQTFGLVEHPPAAELAGTTEYSGEIGGLSVRLWAVTNRTRWDQATTTYLYATAHLRVGR